MIEKSEEVTFTKRITRSGNSIVLSVPKDIADLLSLKGGAFVEVTLKEVTRVAHVVEEVAER